MKPRRVVSLLVLGYEVELDATATNPAATFVFTAAADEQELNMLGRSVHEGLFEYTGTLDGGRSGARIRLG